MEAREERAVRLFEIPVPDLEQCLLTWWAAMKCANLAARAHPGMWCRFPGRVEYFSEGFRHVRKGRTEGSWCETLFRLGRGEREDTAPRHTWRGAVSHTSLYRATSAAVVTVSGPYFVGSATLPRNSTVPVSRSRRTKRKG